MNPSPSQPSTSKLETLNDKPAKLLAFLVLGKALHCRERVAAIGYEGGENTHLKMLMEEPKHVD